MAGGGSSGSGYRRGRPPPSRPQRYDRAKFLQANFRFLVSGAWLADGVWTALPAACWRALQRFARLGSLLVC
jgi:hypothetical protein